jgi:hypothetical protein
MEGRGAERVETRQLLVDVLETYLPLSGRDAEEYEELLRRPENQGIRQTMKTWLEQHEEAAEARGRRAPGGAWMPGRLGDGPASQATTGGC